MPVPLAYAAVVMIWSTTPITIAWSAQSFSPEAALLARMALAAVIGWGVMRLLRMPLPWHREAVISYGAAVLGICGGMYSGYLASLYVPSGLISIIFGLSPLISAVLAYWLIGEGGFNPGRWLGLVLGVVGLAVIFSDDLILGEEGHIGVMLLLLGVSLHSLSAILVKRCKARVSAFAQTVGALILCVPILFLLWVINGAQMPALALDDKGLWAMLYLAVFGSLVGFICYYFLLQQLQASTVALITMMSPVAALMIGHFFNGEPLTFNLVLGTVIIITALGCYNFSGARRLALFRRRSEAPELD